MSAWLLSNSSLEKEEAGVTFSTMLIGPEVRVLGLIKLTGVRLIAFLNISLKWFSRRSLWL